MGASGGSVGAGRATPGRATPGRAAGRTSATAPERPTGPPARRGLLSAAAVGAAVGLLGGLIGLGGAEFRLPLLIGLFGFAALPAVIVNKALSLVVVATALPARLLSVPLTAVTDQWAVVVNLLAGSLVGAYLGATWATRMAGRTLYRVLAALLVLIAAALLANHYAVLGPAGLTGPAQFAAGVLAGTGIGIVAALMGVAGGELLIPTIVLLYGLDLKTAGSLSLAVSLPTMLVAFARYSRDRSFAVLGANRAFVTAMAAGSVAGATLGGALLGSVPTGVLSPLLALLLLASSVKVWKHQLRPTRGGPGTPGRPRGIPERG